MYKLITLARKVVESCDRSQNVCFDEGNNVVIVENKYIVQLLFIVIIGSRNPKIAIFCIFLPQKKFPLILAVQHHMASGILFRALPRYGGGFPDNTHLIILILISIFRFSDFSSEKIPRPQFFIGLSSYSKGS